MAIHEFSNGEIREMGIALQEVWNNEKQHIKVSGGAMYAIIAAKRTLSIAFDNASEAVRAIAESFGATPNAQGNLSIPADKVDEVNQRLAELSDEKVPIEFRPIKLTPSDELPPTLMDIFFDFIEMGD